MFSLILLCCAAACAQGIDGLSVSVTWTVTLPADEAAFTVLVSGALDVTADQALQALQTAGLQNLSVTGTGLGQTYAYPEPAAVQASSPTLTGATKVVSTPPFTRLPIVVRCLLCPS